MLWENSSQRRGITASRILPIWWNTSATIMMPAAGHCWPETSFWNTMPLAPRAQWFVLSGTSLGRSVLGQVFYIRSWVTWRHVIRTKSRARIISNALLCKMHTGWPFTKERSSSVTNKLKMEYGTLLWWKLGWRQTYSGESLFWNHLIRRAVKQLKWVLVWSLLTIWKKYSTVEDVWFWIT